MSKLLMRGALSPYDTYTPMQIMVRDYIGTNSGNLLYASSVYRTLSCDGIQIDMDHYAVEGNRYSDADIHMINETYDAYVLPLEDAFREDFAEKLSRYATFIRKLTIPCYVIGVGLRTEYEPDNKFRYKFDEHVKQFVSAVLDKSSLIGVRGFITGEYLATLGFKEDRDYKIIGCPSMYYHGNCLQQRQLKLNVNTKISLNYRKFNQIEIMRYLYQISEEYPEYQFVGQSIEELRSILIGTDVKDSNSALYPYNMQHKFHRENKMKFYLGVDYWINSMQHIDLSIGTRLHGNVAALLGGARAIFVLGDGRMRELAEYHGFPSIYIEQFCYEESLEKLVEKMDFSTYMKKQNSNFERYISFLNQNGIKHIYSGNNSYSLLKDEIKDMKSYAILGEDERKTRIEEFETEKKVWAKIRNENNTSNKKQ